MKATQKHFEKFLSQKHAGAPIHGAQSLLRSDRK